MNDFCFNFSWTSIDVQLPEIISVYWNIQQIRSSKNPLQLQNTSACLTSHSTCLFLLALRKPKLPRGHVNAHFWVSDLGMDVFVGNKEDEEDEGDEKET